MQRDNVYPISGGRRGGPQDSLAEIMAAKVVGQPHVMEALIPCIEMFQAGLSPENRPAGVFLLLGPTGTGKTRTVEALAEALHGNAKSVLKIDCGEYQMEHEVAKLIGAPPGYLGHRETQPALTQQKLSAVASEKCALSLVLFDEIEKAAPSMARLMLGLLDRGILRLGDNTQVNFEKTIVFMTSNLGAREMMREIAPEVGFQSAVVPPPDAVAGKLEKVAMSAVRRKFSPEFVNRLDHIITYQPLDAVSLAAIVDHEVEWLQRHVVQRLSTQAFSVDVPFVVRQWLLEHGTSVEYGARELKRTIHRHLTQPLASLVTRGRVEPTASVKVAIHPDGKSLMLKVGRASDPFGNPNPTVLIVDGNRELVGFWERMLSDKGWAVHVASSAAEAKRVAAKRKPHAALIDASLPDERGINLALQLPGLRAIVTTEEELPRNEERTREENRIAILYKPFLLQEVMNMVRVRIDEYSMKRPDDPPRAA